MGFFDKWFRNKENEKLQQEKDIRELTSHIKEISDLQNKISKVVAAQASSLQTLGDVINDLVLQIEEINDVIMCLDQNNKNIDQNFSSLRGLKKTIKKLPS